MNILTKGLLVATVPFLCQVIFIGWLIAQLWDVQNQAAQAALSREIASEAHLVFLQYAQLVETSINHHGQASPLAVDPGGHLANLDTLCAGDSERQKFLKVLKDESNTLVSTSIDVSQKQREMSKRKERSEFYLPRLIFDQSKKVFFAAADMIAHEQNSIPFVSSRSLTKIDELISAILIFAVVSGGVSLLLGWFYAAGIRKPLSLLHENTVLLSQQAPLLPLNPKNDEIGQVDKLLHEVSDALYEALSRERELLDNAVAMVCALSETGVISAVNPFAENLLGIERSKILNSLVYNYIWPEDVVRADAEFNSIRYLSLSKSVEFRIKGSSGVPIETRWSMQGTAGQPEVFCVVYDISEEKNVEKLKQNFIEMVTDDLRNPLKTMLTTVGALLNGNSGPLTHEANRELEVAKRSVERLVAFVNDFVDFQRLDAGNATLQFEPHALKSIVDDALASVSELAKQKNVSLQPKPMDATVVCDRPRVVQILVNLLSNAIKFSPDGGTVDVFYAPRGGVQTLCVSDTGPGIAPEYRQKIFEAFEQVPGAKSKDGTGLGLAICKMMAQGHGWTLSVENRNESEFYRDQPGATGAVFCISIPSPLRFGSG